MATIDLRDSKWLVNLSVGLHLLSLAGVVLISLQIIWTLVLVVLIGAHWCFWIKHYQNALHNIKKLILVDADLRFVGQDGLIQSAESFELVICSRYLLVLRIHHGGQVRVVPVVRDMVAGPDQWRLLSSWRAGA